VAFAVAKGFGAQERIWPFLYQQAGVVDKQGRAVEAMDWLREVLDRLFAYVNATNVQALGVIGIILTVYAAYTVLSSVDSTLNQIWSVRRRRSAVRRFADYMAILLVAPLLLIVTAAALPLLQSETVMGRLAVFAPAAPAWSRWMCESRRWRTSVSASPRSARLSFRRGRQLSGPQSKSAGPSGVSTT
jgi:membrane protein